MIQHVFLILKRSYFLTLIFIFHHIGKDFKLSCSTLGNDSRFVLKSATERKNRSQDNTHILCEQYHFTLEYLRTHFDLIRERTRRFSGNALIQVLFDFFLVASFFLPFCLIIAWLLFYPFIFIVKVSRKNFFMMVFCHTVKHLNQSSNKINKIIFV